MCSAKVVKKKESIEVNFEVRNRETEKRERERRNEEKTTCLCRWTFSIISSETLDGCE